jgi:hypothetical protein
LEPRALILAQGGLHSSWSLWVKDDQNIEGPAEQTNRNFSEVAAQPHHFADPQLVINLELTIDS